jgi:hypothetical protein
MRSCSRVEGCIVQRALQIANFVFRARTGRPIGAGFLHWRDRGLGYLFRPRLRLNPRCRFCDNHLRASRSKIDANAVPVMRGDLFVTQADRFQ